MTLVAARSGIPPGPCMVVTREFAQSAPRWKSGKKETGAADGRDFRGFAVAVVGQPVARKTQLGERNKGKPRDGLRSWSQSKSSVRRSRDRCCQLFARRRRWRVSTHRTKRVHRFENVSLTTILLKGPDFNHPSHRSLSFFLSVFAVFKNTRFVDPFFLTPHTQRPK